MKNYIELKNLTVSFKQKKKNLRIIRGVDIEVKPGQIIGLVGESGSGKSVTVKALMNLNSNAITTFDSLKIADKTYETHKGISWKKIRGHEIAYISQNPMTSLNPTRKIYKQFNDVLLRYKKELKTKKQRMNYMLEMLEEFGIRNPQDVLKHYPHSLSGGMKQRIVVAMSVSTNAKVLVADEPTTALDATVQSSVLGLLQTLTKKYKIAIIFISHDISVVARLCDYLYVLYAGRVIERGTRKEVFTDPKHPYTWALISSMPDPKSKKLYSISGNPPDMANLPAGDPFAPRNQYAVAIDFKREPPLFKVTKTHSAATWMLHPSYPKTDMPKRVKDVVNRFTKAIGKGGKK